MQTKTSAPIFTRLKVQNLMIRLKIIMVEIHIFLITCTSKRTIKNKTNLKCIKWMYLNKF